MVNSMIETPPLSGWARLSRKYDGCEMVRGDDLRPGDTLYFRDGAYGRELYLRKSDFCWSAMVLKPGDHHRSEAVLNPDTWYVTRRAALVAPPQPVEAITRLRVQGDDLAVGDIVSLGSQWTPYRAEILTIGEPDITSGGWARYARIGLKDGEKRHYTFKSNQALFHVVGGPKIGRANADPGLVWQTPTGPVWRGG